MSERAQLDEELCFRADGHVADVALSLLADAADEFVPAIVRDHADQCEVCLERLAGFAHLSLEAGGALENWQRPPVRFPLGALWVALAIPALAIGRTYGSDERILSPVRAAFASLALLRSLLATAERGLSQLETPVAVLPVVASIVFVLGGLAIAHLVPQASLRGNVA
jgi:hypothetical protein